MVDVAVTVFGLACNEIVNLIGLKPCPYIITPKKNDNFV